MRWGAASEGDLFRRDGGKTFAALCSAAITPLSGIGADAGIGAIARVSSLAVNSNAGTLLDGEGHLHTTQLSGLWSDDGTGCAWSRGLVGGWPTSLQLDPETGELLALVHVSSGPDAEREVRRAVDAGWHRRNVELARGGRRADRARARAASVWR